MLVIISTDSYYTDWCQWGEKIDSIPEGQIYHRVHSSKRNGIDHFFSDKPITNDQIDDHYKGSDIMSMEKFKKQEYYTISCGEFEKLVKESYGMDSEAEFSFAEARECSNDSDHSFLAERRELDEYDQENIQKLIEDPASAGYCTIDTIFDDLCNKGIIEPGHYLVSICW